MNKTVTINISGIIFHIEEDEKSHNGRRPQPDKNCTVGVFQYYIIIFGYKNQYHHHYYDY